MFRLPWRRTRADDAGSMPVALLVTLVGVTLAAGTSGMVISQVAETKRVEHRARAITAAQAGLDANVAKIRSLAAVAAPDDRLAALRCDRTDAALSESDAKFTTTVAYFSSDPSGWAGTLKPVGDLTNLTSLPGGKRINETVTLPNGDRVELTRELLTALSNVVPCVNNSPSQTPQFALLRSQGTFNGVRRTLYATYSFRTSVPDGEVEVPGNPTLRHRTCLGSKSMEPSGHGSDRWVVTIECSADDVQKRYEYTLDQQLRLPDTTNDTRPYGLCVSGPEDFHPGVILEFHPCDAPGQVGTDQKWKYDAATQTFWSVEWPAHCMMRNGGSEYELAHVVLSTNANRVNCGTVGTYGYNFVLPQQSAPQQSPLKSIQEK